MLKRLLVTCSAIGALAVGEAFSEVFRTDLSSDDLDKLASHPTWLKLGRYKNDFGSSDDLKSDIITDEYFLSVSGRSDPRAELLAALDEFSVSMPDDPNQSAICRYPGRVYFLRQETSLNLPDPVDVCPDYSDFVTNGDVNGISLLFIGSYLENPGSAFGHLLLRFHSDDDATLSIDINDVLDTGINYGAADSEEDPLIPYIVKGLSGQYHSTFTTLPFFHHSERYQEDQLRNVWEYRLDIDQDAVDLMTGHTWELLGVKNKYYFFRQNCAYRMAEMVELGTGTELISKNKVWVAPMDVFHAMMEQDKTIVKSVKRLASRETVFNEGYRALSDAEKQFVDTVLSEPGAAIEEQILLSNVEDPREALSVVLDRFAYQNNISADRQKEVLLARFQRAPSQRRDLDPPQPPHEGDKTSLLQASVLQNEDLGTGLELRIRPAYFDFLSKTVGTAPYSELSMADTRVLIRDSEIYLRQLEAVRVTALNTNVSGAPGAKRYAWRVRLGLQDRDLACDGCLVGYAEGGFGRGYQIQDGLAVYGLASAQLEVGDDAFSTLQAKAIAGAVWTTDTLGVHLEGAFVNGIDDTDQSKFIGKGELRFGGGKDWEFGAGVRYDEAAEGFLSLNRYW